MTNDENASMDDRDAVTGGGDSAADTRPSLADGQYTAVLDRFEQTDRDSERWDGELAVLFLESGETVVAERVVPAWRLPDDARQQDAVLSVRLRNGFVVTMDFDAETTERRGSAAQSRFDRLAERPDDESDGASDGA